MKQVSKASQLNKSVKQVSLASQVKQVGLASQVSNLPKSSQESEIKKVLVKQVQVKQVKSSKFKLSNLNQASEVMLDRDTAPRKPLRHVFREKAFQIKAVKAWQAISLGGLSLDSHEQKVFCVNVSSAKKRLLVKWR